jgi:hypothetical protein
MAGDGVREDNVKGHRDKLQIILPVLISLTETLKGYILPSPPNPLTYSIIQTA